MYLPDVFRAITIAMLIIYMVFLPHLLLRMHRPSYTWYAIAIQDLAFICGVILTIEHWGQPLVIWRSPLLFIAGCFGMAYIYKANKDYNERDSVNRVARSRGVGV